VPGELRDKGMGERWLPPVDGRWTLRADLYVDCTGLRAKLIGEALQVPFTSCGDSLLSFETARARYAAFHSAQRAFKQIQTFARQAVHDLPPHRTLIEQIYREGFRGKPSPAGVPNAGRNR